VAAVRNRSRWKQRRARSLSPHRGLSTVAVAGAAHLRTAKVDGAKALDVSCLSAEDPRAVSQFSGLKAENSNGLYLLRFEDGEGGPAGLHRHRESA